MNGKKKVNEHIPKIDRETIIIFNDAEDKAYVYTCNRHWIAQLQKYGFKVAQEYADEIGIYAKEYEVPKNLIKIPRSLTQKEMDQRMAQAERLRKYRFTAKKPQSPA